MTNAQVDNYKEYEETFDETDIKSLSFEELIEYRKAIGYRVYGVKLDIGVIIDRAWYMDLTWECLEELADACVYLDFEVQKLRNREAKLDAVHVTVVYHAFPISPAPSRSKNLNCLRAVGSGVGHLAESNSLLVQR